MMRWIHFLFCLMLIAPLAMSMAHGAPARLSLAGTHLVEIGGGRRLNLLCTGQGSPTVLFLQAAGGGMVEWHKVQAPVAARTRTCLYDRAGFGFSDPPVGPVTALSATDDLHALLGAARIGSPFVLVGHSLGGLFATTYADRFPGEVAGMVLVDPSFAGQFDAPLSEQGRIVEQSDMDKFLTFLHGCAALARDAKLSMTDAHGCFRMPNDAPASQRAGLEHQFLSPAYYESGASELRNLYPDAQGASLDGEQEKRLTHDFGQLPLTVLTAGIPPRQPAWTDEDNRRFTENWTHGHDSLARRSGRGQAIMVEGASHDIQIDRPQSVIDAIFAVIVDVRGADHSR
jgi:pimeloyl-ACP methyl ester carboxylesterase